MCSDYMFQSAAPAQRGEGGKVYTEYKRQGTAELKGVGVGAVCRIHASKHCCCTKGKRVVKFTQSTISKARQNTEGMG